MKRKVPWLKWLDTPLEEVPLVSAAMTAVGEMMLGEVL